MPRPGPARGMPACPEAMEICAHGYEFRLGTPRVDMELMYTNCCGGCSPHPKYSPLRLVTLEENCRVWARGYRSPD